MDNSKLHPARVLEPRHKGSRTPESSMVAMAVAGCESSVFKHSAYGFCPGVGAATSESTSLVPVIAGSASTGSFRRCPQPSRQQPWEGFVRLVSPPPPSEEQATATSTTAVSRHIALCADERRWMSRFCDCFIRRKRTDRVLTRYFERSPQTVGVATAAAHFGMLRIGCVGHARQLTTSSPRGTLRVHRVMWICRAIVLEATAQWGV